MSDSFVHLHVHTEYSMLDGAAKVKPLLEEAQRLGMPALAVTDHGNLHAAAEFYRRAQDTAVKPIIGVEAYVAPGSRLHKKPVFWGQPSQRVAGDDGRGGDVAGSGAFTHMTMLARTPTGLRNLFRMSSRASFEGRYRGKARFDRDLMAEYADGLLATTGCPGGEIQTRLRLGQYDEALQAAGQLRDIFGAGNFYLELMDHGIAVERRVRSGLLDIGAALGLPPLATNDSHYVTEDQAGAHAALLCVQTGKTLDDPQRFKFDGEGYYLKSAAQMREYWDREAPGAADNTLLLAERVEAYDEVFREVNRMPQFPLAEGETEDLLLRRDVERYLPERFPLGLPSGYRERIDFELDVIKRTGYPGYFLVVGDVVRWAKSQGILVGPGRGSATGSLVAYVVKITDLDPIEHSLIFERFLNPERVSPPDIDLDFDERRRGEVLQYTLDTWGTEAVAQVITFGTIKTKAAIKDAARVLYGQSGFAIADRISKALPPAIAAEDISLQGITDPSHPRHGEAAEVRALAESDPQVAAILRTARGLEGLVRNAGVHACAVILSSQPLFDVIPLWQRDDGAIITAWHYEDCERLGLLKMDYLGLRTLTVLDDTVQAVREHHGVDIDLTALPLDDERTYELLSTGDTLGVFQLDGNAMRDLLRRMRPKTFGDIAAVLALYRPGPMAANAHIAYAERSNGRQDIAPIHPELADALWPILGETYHLLVYQEQVMAIAQQLAGYTLGAADLLRRAMGKKKKEIIEKEFERFCDGMAHNDFSVEATQTLWDVMVPFSGYAFNKSHTAGYGLVSYWTAYCKANYPAEFMGAQLTSIGDKKDKSAIYLAECRRMGIRVLPPDINASQLRFAATGPDIRYGIGAIRNVGPSAARAILDQRAERGPYEGFADFLERADLACCNKRTVESLIKAGCFDAFGDSRRGLTAIHEDAVEAVATLKKQLAAGQFDLFATDPAAGTDAGFSPLAHLTAPPGEWPRKQLLAHERDMLGLYVSAHPLDGAETILRKYAPQPIGALLAAAPAEGEAAIAGMITKIDRKTSKNGAPWAIATIEDLDAEIDVLFFARAYAALQADLVTDAAVAIKGRINWREDTMSIFGSALIPLDITAAEYNTAGGAPLVVRIDVAIADRDAVHELRSTLAAHHGSTPVQLAVCHHGRQRTLDVPDYPVTVSPALRAELACIKGMTVAR